MHLRNKIGTGTLLKNVIIYFFGTVISKILNIIFIPIITIYLTTAEFGYFDLIITTISLLLPIFTIQSIDAVFRFLFDADEIKKKRILTNVWLIIGLGSLIFMLLSLLFNYYIYNINNVFMIIIYYNINVFINMYQRIARSYGMNLVFSISGIIQAGIMLLLEVCFLSLFDMNVDGMLLAYIISGIISCVYLEYNVRALKGLKLSFISKNEIKEIVKLSIPLIPNNICWWATASINKFIILFYIGESANGLYAITLKFASIIAMVTSVFSLAWQESTISEYSRTDKDEYFSYIFKRYFTILILSTLILIFGLKISYKYLVSLEYYGSWIYLPATLIGTVFTAISSFYGTGYLAAKKTSGAFYTTVFAAFINILICGILIRFIGIMAAPIASMIAYLVLWIIRHNTMKSYYNIIIDKKNILVLSIAVVISTFIFYSGNMIFNLICLISVIVVSILYCYNQFKNIFNIEERG